MRSHVPRVAVAAAPLVERRESAERLSHDYHGASQYRVIFRGEAVSEAGQVADFLAHRFGVRALLWDWVRAHGPLACSHFV